MASAVIHNTKIAGVASAVPSHYETVEDLATTFGKAEATKISDYTGVKKRHLSGGKLCTSDLCFEATQNLLHALEWSAESVDVLIFVSQTPDYLLPATSCCLQERLLLSNRCACLDVNLGCSGYVYGLWLGASVMMAGGLQRALLLCGDTGPYVSPLDRTTFPLFGEAGTATAIELDRQAPPMFFELGTDGAGAQHLMVPVSGFRNPRTPDTAIRTKREGGNVRSDEDLYMNGAEIFTFTLREVPALVNRVIELAGRKKESVDAYIFHQANKFMLQHLAKKMKLPNDRFVIDLEEFGNTSSASIPLAITNKLSGRLSKNSLSLVLAGFGVGYSWGAAMLECGPCTVCGPDLVDIAG